MAVERQGTEPVRTAELTAALCLGTDLGMGFPFEHGQQTTLIAMRLANRLGVDRETASQTYYTCLLSHAGCTTDAHVAAEVFGGSMTTTFGPVMYGSGRQAATGLLRTLPDPEAAAPCAWFRSPAGSRGWLVSCGLRSSLPARWRECWPRRSERLRPCPASANT